MRVFLAVELDPETRSALEAFQRQLHEMLPAINWVRPQSWHLTVKFLGEVEENQLEPIKRAVEKAVSNCSSFSLQIEGFGGFPHLRNPRVLWAGVTGQVDELHLLALHVDEALSPLGFPLESKPFRAHLTLARIKDRAREVGVALTKLDVLENVHFFGELTVERLCLFRSELKPTGANYHRLWAVPLAFTCQG